jgi:hypothetical protein
MPNHRGEPASAGINKRDEKMIRHIGISRNASAIAAKMSRLKHYRDGHDHRACCALVHGPRIQPGDVTITQIAGAR